MLQLQSYSLYNKIIDEFGFIPKGFLDNLPKGKSFIYLACCNQTQPVFFYPSLMLVTGFTIEEMIAGGIDMQISRIHPDDLDSLYNKALRIISNNISAVQQQELPAPLVLNYRIRRADGEWRNVVETKIFRYSDNGTRNRVLGKVVDITEQAINNKKEAQKFLHDSGDDYPLLNALLNLKKNTEKSPLQSSVVASNAIPEGMAGVTKREKEILYLIGSGLSTKQIASQLFISITPFKPIAQIY